MPFNTINVIEVESKEITSVRSFPDDPSGAKQARAHFREMLWERGYDPSLTEQEISEAWDKKKWDIGGYAVHVFHSSVDYFPENFRIKQWIQDGEFDAQPDLTVKELTDQMSGLLDSACSWDIAGSPLMLGSDGIFYTVVTEMSLVLAAPEYIIGTIRDECSPEIQDEMMAALSKYQEWKDK